MREIYTAPTVDAAQARFDEFAEQWRERYPAMIDTWERSWGEFTAFPLGDPIRRERTAS